MNYKKVALLFFLFFLFRIHTQEATITVYLYDNVDCSGTPLENSLTVLTNECFYGRDENTTEPLPGFIVNTTDTFENFDVEVCNDGHCLDCEIFPGIQENNCFILNERNQSLLLFNFESLSSSGIKLDIKKLCEFLFIQLLLCICGFIVCVFR